MKAIPSSLLTDALRQPQGLSSLNLAQWDALVRKARQARLLARLARVLDAQGALEAVPSAPRSHLQAALIVADAQHRDLLYELDCIGQALADAEIRPLLLGGAAYVAAGMLPALGRGLTRIAMLAPVQRSSQGQAALMARGWMPLDGQGTKRLSVGSASPTSLRHLQRLSLIEWHDAARPGSLGYALPMSAFLETAQSLASDARFTILAPTEMTLCNAARLFGGSDLDTALRDLSDLDLLLRRFGQTADFWPAVARRADQLSLRPAFHHGLRWANTLFGTPAPSKLLADAARRGAADLLRDTVWARALRRDTTDSWSALVRRAWRWRMGRQ
jgi:hypothetical protein